MQDTNKFTLINEILKKYNITQTELAFAMKIRHASIHNYFSGKRRITQEMYLRMLFGIQEIAKQKEITAIKLQMKINHYLKNQEKETQNG